jgi:hypothetical protein
MAATENEKWRIKLSCAKLPSATEHSDAGRQRRFACTSFVPGCALADQDASCKICTVVIPMESVIVILARTTSLTLEHEVLLFMVFSQGIGD